MMFHSCHTNHEFLILVIGVTNVTITNSVMRSSAKDRSEKCDRSPQNTRKG